MDLYLLLVLCPIPIVAWAVWYSCRKYWLWRFEGLRAIIEDQEERTLFFDERDHLVYFSPGLVIFDRRRAQRELRLPEKPGPGGVVRGEMQIDHNRYRYTGKLLEYRPGRTGTLIRLVYMGPDTAKV